MGGKSFNIHKKVLHVYCEIFEISKKVKSYVTLKSAMFLLKVTIIADFKHFIKFVTILFISSLITWHKYLDLHNILLSALRTTEDCCEH